MITLCMIIGGIILVRSLFDYQSRHTALIKEQTRIHEARVSNCVWRDHRGDTWQQCEERVSRMEAAE